MNAYVAGVSCMYFKKVRYNHRSLILVFIIDKGGKRRDLVYYNSVAVPWRVVELCLLHF